MWRHLSILVQQGLDLGSGHNLSDGGADIFSAKRNDPPKSMQRKFDPPSKSM